MNTTHYAPATALPWAVIDIEAANPGKGGMHIIEIAIHRWFDGTLIDKYETLIRPPSPLEGKSCIGHKVRQHHVEDAPVFAEVVGDISTRLQGCVVVGHAVSNDTRMLRTELGRISPHPLRKQLTNPATYDTFAQWERHHFCARGRLKDLAAHFDVQPQGKLHTARVDAALTADVASNIAARYDSENVTVAGDICVDAPTGPTWTWEDFYAKAQ